jgi:hypothetical protein
MAFPIQKKKFESPLKPCFNESIVIVAIGGISADRLLYCKCAAAILCLMLIVELKSLSFVFEMLYFMGSSSFVIFLTVSWHLSLIASNFAFYYFIKNSFEFSLS